MLTKTCKQCGQPFKSKNKKKEYCSDKCQQLFNNLIFRAKRKAKISGNHMIVICPVCGEKFKKHNNNQIYCSFPCQRKGDRTRSKIKKIEEAIKNEELFRDFRCLKYEYCLTKHAYIGDVFTCDGCKNYKLVKLDYSPELMEFLY